jgi:hypothetical protein
LAAIPAAAQTPASEQSPRDLSIGATDSQAALPLAGTINIGDLGLRTVFSSKGDPTRPMFDGIPRWQLGIRTSRQVLSRVQVGVAASATRGHEGSAMWSSALGTGEDLSVPSPFSGPGTYRTVWNTTLSIAVPIRKTDRVNLKAVGELWNPFAKSKDGSTDTLLHGRAFRIGIAAGF